MAPVLAQSQLPRGLADGFSHGEYVRFWYTGGEIVLDGERSRSRLAAIKPASVLAVAPYGNLDEVLGGRTFGFIAGGAMVLQPMQPTEGGA